MNEKITEEELRKLIQDEILRSTLIIKIEDELLTRKATAKILNIEVNTLAVWAMEGRGPAPTKIGTRSMYRLSILDKYIEDQTMPR